MKTSGHKTEFQPSKGLCCLSNAVLITAIALLAVSCKTTKRNSTTHARDSLSWNKEVNVTLATIPSEKAILAVPMDSLRRLPAGAIYQKQQGRASATIGRKGDTLVVTAHCDSLQLANYRLSEELDRLRNHEANSMSEREPAAATLWDRFKAFSAGMIIGIILTIVTKFIYKLWQKRK